MGPSGEACRTRTARVCVTAWPAVVSAPGAACVECVSRTSAGAGDAQTPGQCVVKLFILSSSGGNQGACVCPSVTAAPLGPAVILGAREGSPAAATRGLRKEPLPHPISLSHCLCKPQCFCVGSLCSPVLSPPPGAAQRSDLSNVIVTPACARPSLWFPGRWGCGLAVQVGTETQQSCSLTTTQQ